ncbi:MAG TPA: hypothetical protein VFV02_14390, partial [Acidimicrobiales bacterium]|nr:hypothetical protein [Acidimicrobiales bacterium]
GSKTVKLFRPVAIKMGEPLDWNRSRVSGNGSESDNASLRAFTDEIMEAISVLSGQERVAHYAKRDRGRLSAPGSEADPIPPDSPDQAIGAGPVFS